MSKRPVEVLLEDMREATAQIQEYTKGLSEDAFLKDRRTSDAVVRNLEIIGEAAGRLPKEFTQQHPEIAWEQIVGLRHRIVHDYFGIDLKLVWQILQQDLPAFQAKLAALP
jgi:uncharacterized protein with HEPN domain